MRGLLAATLLFVTPAFAEEPPIEAMQDASYSCTSGEDHDGGKITEEASKAACIQAIELLLKISDMGYCRAADLTWKPCGAAE